MNNKKSLCAFLGGSVLLYVLGCGQGAIGVFATGDKGPEGKPDFSGAAAATAVGAGSDAGAGERRACQGKAALAGDQTRTLESGALTRTYLVHLPTGYDPTRPTPLVLNFHGYSSNASEQKFYTRMREKSDSAGFVAVHPEGVGKPQSWNAGLCCGEAVKKQVDDVAFVSAMLDAIEDELCIDPDRVFATGMSNGGFMTNRLACDLSDRIAAFAPVAGQNLTRTCTPSHPVPVLHFHGTADSTVPYEGDPDSNWPSVPTSLAAWAQRDGCATSPIELSTTIDSRCESWPTCQEGSEVILCTVQGGAHTWPGGIDIPSLGYVSKTLLATDLMWDFFQRHPRG